MFCRASYYSACVLQLSFFYGFPHLVCLKQIDPDTQGIAVVDLEYVVY
jgi:hypothetical protein